MMPDEDQQRAKTGRRVEVREATAEDAAAFAAFMWRLWGEAGPDAPGFAGATEELISEITQHDAVVARLGGPTHRLFVAIDDDVVVGFAATRADDDHVELSGIVVSASHAGRGIGSRLVDCALATARADGHRLVTVRTEVTNAAALAFYERRGFERSLQTLEQVEHVSVPVWELRTGLEG